MLRNAGVHAESPFLLGYKLPAPELIDKFLSGISPERNGTYTVNGDVLTVRDCVVDNIADLNEFTVFCERERGPLLSSSLAAL
jgi:hypothetical protein